MVTQTLIRKVLPFEVKEVAPRVLEFIGSTEDKDRMGDIIIASGWQLKNYKKNPVFLWAHQYDMPPVGKAVKVWTEEDKLKFHVQFPTREEYEFADTIYKLYKGGYLRATSVGFMPLESEPIEQEEDEHLFHPPTRYLKQDLLELSGCPVPANPHALAEAKTKGLISDEERELIEKPYANEHSCRLESPDKYDRFNRKNCDQKHDGKCIDVIYGIKEGKSEIQSLRYGTEIWTESAARAHCKEREGTFEPATEEEKEIKSAISYQSDHPDGTPRKAGRDISQEQIADEIDYLLTATSQTGLNEANTGSAWLLVNEIMRLSGDDIPVDICEKIGAVLNKANRERLEKIRMLAQEVIDSAEREEEPEKGLTIGEITEIVQASVSQIIREAQGKIIKR